MGKRTDSPMAAYHLVGTAQNTHMDDPGERYCHPGRKSPMAEETMTQATSHESLDRKPIPRPYSTAWHDSVGRILLACFLFLLPLGLCAALIYLVYHYLVPTNATVGTSYSVTENNQTHGTYQDYYYIAYPATRLVFISSLSSTLALALVPVGMGLFAYRTAFSLQGASRRGDFSALPSPYQFELCIRILGGGMMDLYRYLTYVAKRKTRRVAAVKALNEAALMLFALLVIGLGVTAVDALLHVRTTTVRLNRLSPFTAGTFEPGRRLPVDCVETRPDDTKACNIIGGGSGAATRLNGTAESFRVLGNASTISSIVMADDGVTSVLTVAKPLADVSFTAQSFASATTCETVTKRCNPQYDYGGCTACQAYWYDCQPDVAGLAMSGNFSVPTNQLSLSQSFFLDAAKTQGNFSYRPYSATDGQMWWASMAFFKNAEINISEALDSGSERSGVYYDPVVDLISMTRGLIFGILSCNTTLFDATYDMDVNGRISNVQLTRMNDTASRPFIQPLTEKYGDVSLSSGSDTVSVTSNTSRQIGYNFARVMDRTILGLAAGYLESQQAVSASKISSSQVAQVPKPDFWALLGLNMLLSLLGIVFTLVVLLLRLKKGVADVQARLDIGALVAALFESREINQTATSVEDSFAELKGFPTSRIMTADQNHGTGGGFVAVAPKYAD